MAFGSLGNTNMWTIQLLNRARRFFEARINANLFELIEYFIRLIEQIICRILKYKIIDCYGDSHVKIFRIFNVKSVHFQIYFRVISVRGATAFGLDNPNSNTNALKVFSKWMRRSKKNPVLFMLGEVDCGFLIWFKAKREKKDPRILMEEAVKRYINFLKSEATNREVLIICSSPLPTIENYDDHGDDVSKFRKMIDVSRKGRTNLALEFNNKIKEWCESNRAIFLDLDRLSIDDVTGEVKPFLLNKDPRNHHYDPDAFQAILLKAISRQDLFERN